MMWGWIAITLCLCMSVCNAQEAYYVDSASNQTTNCGSSWADACGTIESGIEAACTNQSTGNTTLWVGPGTYSVTPISISCNLQIRSTNGSGQTVIRDSKTGSDNLFNFESQEAGVSSFEGFTFSFTIRGAILHFYSHTNESHLQVDDLRLNFVNQTGLFTEAIVVRGAASLRVSNIQCIHSNLHGLLHVTEVSQVNITGVSVNNSLVSALVYVNQVDQFTFKELRVESLLIVNSLLNITRGVVDVWLDSWDVFDFGGKYDLEGVQCFVCGTTGDFLLTNMNLIGDGSSFHNFLSFGKGSLTMSNITLQRVNGAELVSIIGDVFLDSVNFGYLQTSRTIFTFWGHQMHWRDVTVTTVLVPTFIYVPNALIEPLFLMENVTFVSTAMDSLLDLTITIDPYHANITVVNCVFNDIAPYFGTIDCSSCALWKISLSSVVSTNTVTLKSSTFNHVQVALAEGPAQMFIQDCEFNQLDTKDRHAINMANRDQLIIENCRFQNSSTYGFLSLQSTKNVTIHSTVFQNNSVSASGFVVQQTTISMDNVTIANSGVASVSGSFIMLAQRSYLTLTNSLMQDNKGFMGGVLAIATATAEISDCQMLNNVATYGGTLYLSQQASATLSRILFDHNSAAIAGGSVWMGGFSTCVMTDCNITHSQAFTEGGGMEVSGNANLTASNLIVSFSSSLEGGCLSLAEYSKSTFVSTVLNNCNASTDGGGLVVSGYADADFAGLVLSDCQVQGVGAGAIVTDFPTLHMTDSFISDNQSPTEGGGIYLDEGSISVFHNVSFVSNSATANGGAVIMTVRSQALFDQCHFSYNTASSKGGSIAMTNNAYATLMDSLFNGSRANAGGAVYLDDHTSLVVNNTQMNDHSALSRGGAIYCASNSQVTVLSSILSTNAVVDGVGGAFAIQDFANITLQNTIISNNQASYGGGIHHISSNYLLAYNSTLKGNQATNAGGAFFFAEQANSEMYDLSCTNNTASNGGCIVANDLAAILLQNAVIQTNEAKLSGGGALLTQQAFLRVERSSVISNVAKTDGGAYWISTQAAVLDRGSTVSNNTATRFGGGVYLQGGQSNFEDCLFRLNSAESGGGVAVGISQSDPHFPFFNNCRIVENHAGSQGGGIYIAQSTDEGTQSTDISDQTQSPPIQRTFLWSADDSEYDFANLTITDNVATNGGGIYVESLKYNIPSFGPEVNLTANIATKYGGALYFGTYIPFTFMYNATFFDDMANFGGSNAAYGTIANSSRAGDFCANCTYLDCSKNATGYQNPDGFASAPSKISFGDNGCPATVALNSNSISIQVFLLDQFDTEVTGSYLRENPYSVTMSYSQPNGGTLTTDNTTQSISPETGAATFKNIQFCGSNNSTYKLQFTATSSSGPTLLFGFDVSCSIYLFGCTSANQQVVTSTSSCDYCMAVNPPPQPPPDNDKMGVISILLLVILALSITLCIILGTIFGIYYRRKLKRDRLNALEIPDFSERPSLTLEDVLNDSSIPQLKWQDVKIGMVIGKGASGLVSQGVWTPADGRSEDIALKELIIGFDELSEDAINEFLVEIKYMSALIEDHIVRFLGILLSPDHSKLYLVTELMHKGSVRDLLTKKNKNIPPSLRLKMAKDAAKGVAYLHSKKLIHRDLKTHNLLVNAGWDTKVSDFGISTVRPTITRAMTCIGTPVYMAPEVLSKNKYSEKADVYSFGIVLMEIFTNRLPYSHPPYDTMNQAMLMYHIIEKGARPAIDDIHPILQHLIEECWATDPRLRPTFPEIIVRLRRLGPELVDPPVTDDRTDSFDYRRDDTSASINEETNPFIGSPFQTEEDPLILPDA